MKTRFLKVQLLFMTLLISMKLSAGAVYPIVLNPQLLPPYSNCLLDYAASKRFNVFVLSRDMNHSQCNFILSIKMKQGNSYLINEKVEKVSFQVNSGIPTIVDITPLLNHVKDIKGNGFRYEEGAYEFVFQAFDANNPNIAVSEPAYLLAYLSQSEPPVCIYPNDNDCVSPTTGGVINFSWTESVAAMPDPSRKFKLEIYEMPDGIFNDSTDYSTRQRKACLNSLVKTQVPIFSDETNVPFYTFVNTSGRLQKNHTYLWRVRIFKDGSNPDGKYTTSDYYKNGGWSEPFTLRYRNCNPWSQVEVKQEMRSNEEAPDLKVEVADVVTISWETDTAKYCGYRVGYNVKDQDSTFEWTTQRFAKNESSWVISKNIARGVNYVARIEGITNCSNSDSMFTEPKKADFKLDYKANNDCMGSVPALSNDENIASLEKGDIIEACGKTVRLTEVTRNDDGSFTGFGVVTLPALPDLAGIRVKFNNINVNTAKELTKGHIVSTKGSNPLTFNVNGLVNKQNAGTETHLQGKIADTKSFGSSNTVSINLNSKNVSVSGRVIGSIVNKDELKGIDDSKVGENGKITFTAKEKGNPIFDNGQEPFNGLQISSYYETKGQWIALEEGTSAKLVARLTMGDSIKADSIAIYIQADEDAVKIENLKWSATKECEFTIFAGNKTEHLNLIAVNKSNGSYNVLGRAFIQSMKHEDITLHLVPVRRDSSTINVDAISKQLNAIYNPLGKYFTVQVEHQFDEKKELEFLNDGLDVSETSLLSLESEDMKQLTQAYIENNPEAKTNEDAYIFICPSAQDPNVKGDMPRNKRMGYVFSNAKQFGLDTDPWTIAHELGHGLFDLEHTFDFGVAKNTTTNLMDYKQGTDTKVWQWTVMDDHHNYTLPFLEDAEDSQWTTDGHYYLFTYIGMLMGLSYEEAEKYGRWAERPDTYVLSKEDLERGYVIMGNGDIIRFSPLNYKFTLKESNITPNVVPAGNGMNIVDYTVNTKDGYVFYLSDNYIKANINMGATITLTQNVLANKQKVVGFDSNGQPVYLFIPNAYSEGDMLENTTWAIGGLQQRNHALTGGYHGVELAFTAYAIKHANELGMTEDVELYLLHRFGDVFAHYNIDFGDVTHNISLDLYIKWLENFFNENLVCGIGVNDTRIRPKDGGKAKEGVYFIDSKFYSTYKKTETVKIILQSIITADSKINRYPENGISEEKLDVLFEHYKNNLSIFEHIMNPKTALFMYDVRASFRKIISHKELHDFFKDIQSSSQCNAVQNANVMYGDQVTCISKFTSGHSEVDGIPDEILKRKELFLHYVKRTMELYPILNNQATVNPDNNPCELIRDILYWSENPEEGKLDGVFQFLIELEKIENLKKNGNLSNSRINIYIPIKSLPKEIDKGLVWFMYSKLANSTGLFKWDFDDAALSQAKILEGYLKKLKNNFEIVGKPEEINDKYKIVIKRK